MATKYWNYVDALAYALALNGTDEQDQFMADSSEWQQAIYDLLEEYSEKLPDQFKHVIFDIKPGGPPYSEQVEHFLHVQAQARLMSSPNPSYQVFEMSPKQKQAIIRMNKDRLSEHRDLLEEFGRALQARMKPKE